MPTDPNMGFSVPTPGVTQGEDDAPDDSYADQVSEALTTIGAHRHTGAPDDGLPIPVAARLYDEDLPLDGVAVTDTRAVSFRDDDDAAADVASLSVRTSTGDLYYRTLSGTLIRITAGAALDTSGDNAAWERVAISGDHTIVNTDTPVLYDVDTSALAIEITLPTAGSVVAGRRYVIADGFGDAASNPITITAAGGDLIDGAAEHLIRSNFAKAVLVSNGSDAWLAFDGINFETGGSIIAPALLFAAEGAGNLTLSTDDGNINIGADGTGNINLTANGDDITLTAAVVTLAGGTIVEKDGATTLQTKNLNAGELDHLLGATITGITYSDADGIALRVDLDSDGSVNLRGGKDATFTVMQQAYSGTGASNGKTLTVQAQAGQTQSGANDNNNGGDLLLAPGAAGAGGSGAAGATGTLAINPVPTTTSSPSAGGGGALPATPVGYIRVKINGTMRRIPYYPDS